MPAGGLAAEIVIEGKHAVNLGARQVERRCDHWDRRLGHVAEGLLQSMQDHQRSAFNMGQVRDDRRAALGIPWFVDWHRPLSRSGKCYAPMRSGIDAKINKADPCC